MKYLKSIKEMLDPMGSWDPKQLKGEENNSSKPPLRTIERTIYNDIIDSMRNGLSPELKELVLKLDKDKSKENIKVANWAAQFKYYEIIQLLLDNNLIKHDARTLEGIKIWISIDRKLSSEEKEEINQKVTEVFNL